MVLLWGGLCLVTRPDRVALNRRASPTTHPPPETLVNNPKPFQLFLERGWKNAECESRALLIAAGCEQHGHNQISLEIHKDVSQNQALRGAGFSTRLQFERGWLGKITRHSRQNGTTGFASQWMKHSLRIESRWPFSGTALAAPRDGMTFVLSLEHSMPKVSHSRGLFKKSVNSWCTLLRPGMLAAEAPPESLATLRGLRLVERGPRVLS